MEKNALYEKAFEFKKTKVWEHLGVKQVFAIQDGERLCFVHVILQEENNPGVVVHVGENGIVGFLRAMTEHEGSHWEYIARMAAMNTLRCLFTSKDDLTDEAVQEVRRCAKIKGLTMRGANAWPLMIKAAPFRVPVPIESESDIHTMEEAFSALLWVDEKVKKKELIIDALEDPSQKVPLVLREGDAFTVEEIPCPEIPPAEYPVGYTENEILKARVKRLKNQGGWACKVILRMSPSQAEGTDELVLPWQLLTVKMTGGREIEVQMVRDYETRTNVMLDKLMEAMVRENVCPKSITVSDDRTERLLGGWCAEMDVTLQRKDEPPVHLRAAADDIQEEDWGDRLYSDEAEDVSEEDLMEHLEGLISVLELMEVMPASLLDLDQIRQNKAELLQMMKDPSMPENIRMKSAKILEHFDSLIDKAQKKKTSGSGRKKKQRRKNLAPEKSYVISVSLGTGCYRHIQISSHALLVDLSDEILDAFDFDDDHAHAFFMDNRSFSWNQAYYMDGIEEGNDPTTNKVTLEETGLRTGQKFKYVFDFGDEWTFQCRVLRELNEITKLPRIIRSKGTPPSQYGYWDDEDDDWDDDDDFDEDDDD